MNRKAKWRILIVLAFLATSIVQTSSSAFAATSLTAIDDQNSVWIVGTDVNGYSCWNLQSSSVTISLQVQVGGVWVSKARAVPKRNSALCTDPSYPYAVVYHWNTDILGSAGDGTSKARVVLARQYIPATKKIKAFTGNVFVKQLYLSQNDLFSDYASTLNNSVASAPGSPTGTSKLSGCTYKGKQLYGNVYISPSYFGADFTVYPTSSSFGADLKVFKTNSYFLATSCGIWNIVNSPISANFSVYLAPSSFSADFNVYFTSSSYSAGLTN
jgi:Family of unknown function (DUF6150)